MPIYEFQCPSCGAMAEMVLPPGDSGETGPACPVCKAPKTTKVLSAHAQARLAPRAAGTTCCGSQERCQEPPCSQGGSCRRG